MLAAASHGSPIYSMRWVYSPAPFSPGSPQRLFKLLCRREAERQLFLRSSLTDQVPSNEPSTTNFQGKRRCSVNPSRLRFGRQKLAPRREALP